MNRTIVFSSQPPNEKIFSLISLEEVKKKGKPVVLVVVKEEAREDMEKLIKEFGVVTLTDFVFYRDHEQEPSDEKYVLKDVLISSPEKKNFLSSVFGLFDRESFSMV